jgi:hypothetical protein
MLAVLLPSVSAAQPLPAARIPDFRIDVRGEFADFTTRIDQYFQMRSRLEMALPPAVVTNDTRQITHRQRALARAIRDVRHGAVQGEFFTRAASADFKLALAVIMSDQVWAVVMDDNPGGFRHAIDGTYPEGRPFSTMPGVILARLPPLPHDIEFRFVGRHLVLYDLRSNTIVDRLPDAIVPVDDDD